MSNEFIGFNILTTVRLTPLFRTIFKCLMAAMTKNTSVSKLSDEDSVPEYAVLCVICVFPSRLIHVCTKGNFTDLTQGLVCF